MKRRVLIVTSSYGPAMMADMHRARHLSWELPGIGWEAEILSPDATYQHPSCIDRDAADFFPPGAAVHFAPQRLGRLLKALGLGSIGWRAAIPMYFAGARLLRSGRFDLVFFSTTQFPLFLLGPAWRKFFGVPYVLDIHDPCYKEGASTPIWATPSIKHALSRWLGKRVESLSVTNAVGLVAVSPRYIDTLRARYGRTAPAWLHAGRNGAIPFGVSAADLQRSSRDADNVTTSPPPSRQITYVGAGGPIMHRSFMLLCKALSRLRELDPESVLRVKFDLRGTTFGWTEGQPRYLHDLARQHGVGEFVDEDPGRVSFRRSIELLLEGDGALVLGVDDAGYMPSKLFSYACAGKPMLAVLRRDSPAFEHFQGPHSLGHCLWFDAREEMPLDAAARELGEFLREVAARSRFDRSIALEPFGISAMARRHGELFDACLS